MSEGWVSRISPAAGRGYCAARRHLNYERLYEYRFRDIDQGARAAVWSEIAPHVHGLMGAPQKVLDPAAETGAYRAQRYRHFCLSSPLRPAPGVLS